MADPCDILDWLKYYTIRCKEINRETSQKNDFNTRSIGSTILGILNIKSVNFVGGTQYHDADEFCVKELINTAFFNSLSFTLDGNNGEPVGESVC